MIFFFIYSYNRLTFENQADYLSKLYNFHENLYQVNQKLKDEVLINRSRKSVLLSDSGTISNFKTKKKTTPPIATKTTTTTSQPVKPNFNFFRYSKHVPVATNSNPNVNKVENLANQSDKSSSISASDTSSDSKCPTVFASVSLMSMGTPTGPVITIASKNVPNNRKLINELDINSLISSVSNNLSSNSENNQLIEPTVINIKQQKHIDETKSEFISNSNMIINNNKVDVPTKLKPNSLDSVNKIKKLLGLDDLVLKQQSDCESPTNLRHFSNNDRNKQQQQNQNSQNKNSNLHYTASVNSTPNAQIRRRLKETRLRNSFRNVATNNNTNNNNPSTTNSSLNGSNENILSISSSRNFSLERTPSMSTNSTKSKLPQLNSKKNDLKYVNSISRRKNSKTSRTNDEFANASIVISSVASITGSSVFNPNIVSYSNSHSSSNSTQYSSPSNYNYVENSKVNKAYHCMTNSTVFNSNDLNHDTCLLCEIANERVAQKKTHTKKDHQAYVTIISGVKPIEPIKQQRRLTNFSLNVKSYGTAQRKTHQEELLYRPESFKSYQSPAPTPEILI